MSHDKFYFYCGSSIMNAIERVAVQGFGLVNILAQYFMVDEGWLGDGHWCVAVQY